MCSVVSAKEYRCLRRFAWDIVLHYAMASLTILLMLMAWLILAGVMFFASGCVASSKSVDALTGQTATIAKQQGQIARESKELAGVVKFVAETALAGNQNMPMAVYLAGQSEREFGAIARASGVTLHELQDLHAQGSAIAMPPQASSILAGLSFGGLPVGEIALALMGLGGAGYYRQKMKRREQDAIDLGGMSPDDAKLEAPRRGIRHS